MKTHLIESDEFPVMYRGYMPATFRSKVGALAAFAVCGTRSREQDLTDVPKFVTCKRCRRYLP